MKIRALVGAVAFLMIGSNLCADLEGYRVISGDVEEIGSDDLHENIFFMHDDVILEFDIFSLAKGERVCFKQENRDSWTLVRILGKEPAKISGELMVEGNLLFVCSAGIEVQGELKSCGLIASTRDLSDEDFLSDELWEFSGTNIGNIYNNGKISTTDSDLFLFAGEILNDGSVETVQEIWAATNEKISLAPSQDMGLELGLVHNRGTIRADRILINSKEVTNTGEIDAVGDAGSLEMIANSGLILMEGNLSAQRGDYGGRIVMRGSEVTFTPRAVVNVSGELGGGEVMIRGDLCNLCHVPSLEYSVIVDGKTVYQGPDLSAEETSELIRENQPMGALKPLFKADALTSGDGGSISIFANEDHRFGALVLARGAGKEGVGGVIELCSQGSLAYKGAVDTKAESGLSGHLLIDPKYAVISPFGTDSVTGNTFASNGAGTVTISGSDLETALNSASVTIQANTDITFGDVVVVTTPGSGLTLQAGRSIIFTNTADLTLNTGDFSATINDAAALNADREPGGAVFQMDDDSRIFSQGGNITIAPGNFTGSFEGEIRIGEAILGSNGGDIDIIGTGFTGLSNSSGIRVSNGIISTTGTGTLTLTGTGGAGIKNNSGVYLTGGDVLILSEAGQLTILGTGGASTETSNQGVRIESGAIVTSTTGAIDVTGNAGTGTDWNIGVILTGTDSKISSRDGDMTITGTGAGTGQSAQGVRLEIGALIESIGADANGGTITVNGAAAPGLANCTGICLSSSGSLITSIMGNISVTGTGDSDTTSICDQGVRLESGAKITSTGTGANAATVTVVGMAGSGTDHNDGIILSGTGSHISSVDGDLNLTGIGDGTGSQNQGIRLESRGSVVSTGIGANAATITATGTGGDGVSMNYGVLLIGLDSLIASQDGDITVTGTAQGTDPTEGVFEQGGSIDSVNGTVNVTSNDVT